MNEMKTDNSTDLLRSLLICKKIIDIYKGKINLFNSKDRVTFDFCMQISSIDNDYEEEML